MHRRGTGVRKQQVAAAILLLDGGATVPFVARYRKEATGALDDAQLRTLEGSFRGLPNMSEPQLGVREAGTAMSRARSTR